MGHIPLRVAVQPGGDGPKPPPHGDLAGTGFRAVGELL